MDFEFFFYQIWISNGIRISILIPDRDFFEGKKRRWNQRCIYVIIIFDLILIHFSFKF